MQTYKMKLSLELLTADKPLVVSSVEVTALNRIRNAVLELQKTVQTDFGQHVYDQLTPANSIYILNTQGSMYKIQPDTHTMNLTPLVWDGNIERLGAWVVD